jgi:tetratricopeptide (TPR) repeat protein
MVEAAALEPLRTTFLDEYLPDSSRQRPEWFPPIPRSLAVYGSANGSVILPPDRFLSLVAAKRFAVVNRYNSAEAHGAMSDWHMVWLEGHKLSTDEAKALEASLAESPDDLRAHIQLLGYYALDLASKQRNVHALWLIANHPELDLWPISEIEESFAPEAHAEAGLLWRAAVEQQPNNGARLKAASAFFTFADRAFAKELLRRGHVLEPNGAHWHAAIGELCMLDSERLESAQEALLEFERALDLESSDLGRYDLMIDAAKAAFFANDFDRATTYATRVLAEAPRFNGTWLHGNGVHHAHIVLGRVALSRDDVQAANEHLMASTQVPTSPQLSSFGPDQDLALALVARGERDAVLAYAKACKHSFGAGLGMLGAVFRTPDGESPRLQVVPRHDE